MSDIRSAIKFYGDAGTKPLNVFSDCICDDIPHKLFFEYCHSHSNTLLQFCLKLARGKPRKAACQPTKFDIINDVRLFPTVYHREYSRKCLTLSNQMCRYNSKYI